ncbi:hypothetical protein DFP72DRAFT_853951 [Ephemerocybe angulata]|uniref:Uncharacterized protein n=1 Tax=Ephemerocybe angulata TaxID=980116 RepID=A0A8H6LZP0_9AGAR|nr:hypothetical protein DFP72DRAFT_853951 [Tulosesus angulatus]
MLDDNTVLPGLSLFLTEEDVFDDPSRTVHLCIALWCFTYHSVKNVHSLLRPCLIDGVLAPTKAQREVYYKKWLHLYAKDTIKIPLRLHVLLQEYESTLNGEEKASGLYDPFEPTHLQEAWDLLKKGFEEDEDTPLSAALIRSLDLLATDPLTSYFCKRGIPIEAPSTLKPLHYESLMAPEAHNFWKYRKIYCYKSPVKTISTHWLIVPTFPDEFTLPRFGDYQSFRQATLHERSHKLFKYIIYNTKSVVIGPLEYRGNATSIITKHRKKIVILSEYVTCVKVERETTVAPNIVSSSSPPATPARRLIPALTFPSSPPATPTHHPIPALIFSSSLSNIPSSPLPLTPKRILQDSENSIPLPKKKRGPYMTHSRELLQLWNDIVGFCVVIESYDSWRRCVVYESVGRVASSSAIRKEEERVMAHVHPSPPTGMGHESVGRVASSSAIRKEEERKKCDTTLQQPPTLTSTLFSFNHLLQKHYEDQDLVCGLELIRTARLEVKAQGPQVHAAEAMCNASWQAGTIEIQNQHKPVSQPPSELPLEADAMWTGGLLLGQLRFLDRHVGNKRFIMLPD